MRANFETGLKICPGCNRELPISQFNKDKTKSDGLNIRCKDCCSKYRKSEEGKEVAKRARKKYYQTEKGKACEKRQTIRRSQDEEWKEKAKIRCKKYYQEHKQPSKRVIRKVEQNENGVLILRCCKCNRILEISNFHKDKYQPCGYDSWCKDCRREYQEKRMQTEEFKEYNRRKQKEFRESEYGRVKLMNYLKSESYRKSLHKYNISEHGRAKRRNYRNEKYKTDINYKIESSLRNRVRSAVTKGYKSNRSIKLLGCSIDELKVHLEQQFEPGMTWENYGEWHIDHIIPCARFDLRNPIHQKICFNYRNLQPLWAKDNSSKHDNLPDGWEDLLEIIKESLDIKEFVDLK